MEFSYGNFASFLLKEVGPTWLSRWSDTEAAESFDVFFRFAKPSSGDLTSPPRLLPPSLVLLALCEGLGGRLVDQAHMSRSGSLRNVSSPDARTVQRVCHLLEPFLADVTLCSNGETLDERSKQPLNARPERMFVAVHPFFNVVGELAWGTDPSIRTKEQAKASLGTLLGEVKDENKPKGGAGTKEEVGNGLALGAPERLASSLCLVPQRVANTLNPLTPYSFTPEGWFPPVGTEAGVEVTVAPFLSHSARTRAGAKHRASLGAVWRALAGRIVRAGRASDLLSAWLRCIIDRWQVVAADAKGGGTWASTPGPDGKCSKAHSSGETKGDWEDWADSMGSASHVWMVSETPESSRGAIVEALLKTLPSTLPQGTQSSHRRRGRQGLGNLLTSGALPERFPEAVCRILIGTPLLEAQGIYHTGHCGWVGPGVEGGGSWGAGVGGSGSGGGGPGSLALLERLLLRRALPVTAGDAIADVLEWCDKKVAAVSSRLSGGVRTNRPMGGGGGGGGGGGVGGGRGFLMSTFCRVAAVWAEPLFLNRSPAKQQELYTHFILAALRSGAMDNASLSSDPEALMLLVRGVGSHLQVTGRPARLRGMRVGEAMSDVIGQTLRFNELDSERDTASSWGGGEAGTGSRAGAGDRDGKGAEEGSQGRAGQGEGGYGGLGGSEGRGVEREGGDVTHDGKGMAKVRKGRRAHRKLKRQVKALPSGGRGIAGGGAGLGGWDLSCMEDLDPDMALPLGEKSGSDSGHRDDRQSSAATNTDKEDADDEEDESWGGGGGKDFDDLEAYNLWDDREDLAGVAKPVYLDRLLELLRSRDQPDTPDKHHVGLRHAETLIRQGTPDLPQRAPELCRDLLFLENSFDLEDFSGLRLRALVAATVAAPEASVYYLTSECWGTGTSEGTKLEILDVMVGAAQELAGYRGTGAGGGEGPGAREVSTLLSEVRGKTQGSSKLLGMGKGKGGGGGRGEGGNEVTKMKQEGSSAEEACVGRQWRVRRWGYRRGAQRPVVRNHFGRLAPAFFYSLLRGMMTWLQAATGYRESSARTTRGQGRANPLLLGSGLLGSLFEEEKLPPKPSPLLLGRLLHALTCLVELCRNCPGTSALAADLLGFAWLVRGEATHSRELRRAVLLAVATGVELSAEGVGSPGLQGEAWELLRWLEACAREEEGLESEVAGAVLGHKSFRALSYANY
ncbi:unnamed protein product [Discosporangium mesarthrocarpum]